MKKLTLKLDDLAVESFDTARTSAGGGTVRAAGGGLTDQATCPYSCDGTCNITCGDQCSWGNSCDYETCSCPYTFDPSPVDTQNSCVIACPVC